MKTTRYLTTGATLLTMAMFAPAIHDLHAADAHSTAGAVRIVYPTGRHPTDAANVQAALNLGGKILLKATTAHCKPTAFNFGPSEPGSGYVSLPPNVTVCGEARGPVVTTISGGHIPLRGVGVARVRIEGIHFDGPCEKAILVSESVGATIEIVGNRVSDVSGVEDADGATVGRGIEIVGVTGKVLIADNVVHRVHALNGCGVVTEDTDGEVIIRHNCIRGTNANGILSAFNAQRVAIVGNTVVPGPAQDPDLTAGNGILIGYAQGGRFFVSGNRVVCENPFADGILVLSQPSAQVNGSLIEGNHVTMHGSLYGGISLYDTASGVDVRDNQVRGEGAFALQIGFFETSEPGTAVANTFQRNRVQHFQATTSAIFLDANATNTVLKNQSGTLIDLGTGTTR